MLQLWFGYFGYGWKRNRQPLSDKTWSDSDRRHPRGRRPPYVQERLRLHSNDLINFLLHGGRLRRREPMFEPTSRVGRASASSSVSWRMAAWTSGCGIWITLLLGRNSAHGLLQRLCTLGYRLLTAFLSLFPVCASDSFVTSDQQQNHKAKLTVPCSRGLLIYLSTSSSWTLTSRRWESKMILCHMGCAQHSSRTSASVPLTRLTENGDTRDGQSGNTSPCAVCLNTLQVIFVYYLKPEVLIRLQRSWFFQPLASNYFSLHRSDLKSALQKQRWGILIGWRKIMLLINEPSPALGAHCDDIYPLTKIN